ncbi:uncharacterized protein LOC135482952 [Lineus longissimus]|uniref:uncharacterized protein LOC135482952 n=1 Tax=Lineus longissimus TaxID=88925 RepID=UPI00315C8555
MAKYGGCLTLRILPFLMLFGIYFQRIQGNVPLDCKLTRKGREYVGYKSTTVSGRTCQRWDKQVPHRHYVVGHAMPEMSLTTAENYCRNPGYGRADPWCYTVDPQVVWEYCLVPYCEEKILNESLPDAKCVATKGKCGDSRCCVYDDYVTNFCDGDGSRVCCLGEFNCMWDKDMYPSPSNDCLSDPAGKLYRGRQFRTVDGHQCQRWDAQYPNRHDTNGVGSSDHNYCRNKYLFGEEDDRSAPWCFTVGNGTEWQLCNTPICVGVTAESYFEPTPQTDDRLCGLAGGTCGPIQCCANGHYSNHLCAGPENRKCCLSWFDCEWTEKKKGAIPLVWPTGSYAIPMSVYSCPDWARKVWETGSATLSSDEHTFNWPSEFQLKGPYTTSNIDLNVCVSVTSPDSSSVVDTGVEVKAVDWPKGAYCILSLNQTCPGGFTFKSMELPFSITKVIGYATYVLENSTNSALLGICCRNDGDITKDVILPPYYSFYLLYMTASCQKVVNMTAKSQVLRISTNGTVDENSIYFCFYEPIPVDTCYKELDSGWDYRGGINVTHKGPCQPWSTFRSFEWSLFIDYAGIAADTNNCRWAYFSLEPIPWCFANNYRIQCGVPKCAGNDYERYSNVALNKPATQMDGNAESAQQAVDDHFGKKVSCTNRIDAHKPWWQVDLRDIHEVHAVQITREDTACPLRLFDIHVSMYPDDFLKESGAFLCRRNFSAGTAYTIVAECSQPVRGQYVTIVNLAHVETDIRVDFKVEACFQICDVKVFAKATHCSLSLTTASGAALPVKHYQVSSSVLGFGMKYAGLFSKNSWCAKTDDQRSKYIQIDLETTRKITGLVTQGNNGDKDATTRTFTVQYSIKSNASFVDYEQLPGKVEVREEFPLSVKKGSLKKMSSVT